MISQEEVLERVLSRVSAQVAGAVQEVVVAAVQRELTGAMTKALVESEFYRGLNEEMRSGLKGIFQEISSASAEDAATRDGGAPQSRDGAENTRRLFNDATRQLEETMQSTLEAAESIMETAERLQSQQEEAGALIAALGAAVEDTRVARLDRLNADLGASLGEIITALSFQDLTGQRLKKVMGALTSIQETVFDLYVASGLMLKGREDNPERDMREIAEESRRKAAEIRGSELKGPSSDAASQQDVDALLAGLGL